MSSLSNRTPAQTEKRAQVEAAVLAATEELLTEGFAFADLKIDRIANRAGISRTAFYFYFRDKRDLLMRLTQDIANVLYTEAEVWWSADGDPAEAMREGLSRIVAVYEAHGRLLRAIVEASTYDEPVGVFWRALVGRFVEATRRRIEREQESGRAPSYDAEQTAFLLIWMTERSCYERLVQDKPLDDPELLDALAGVWIRGVYGRV